jgi:putative heme degradation protein
MLNGESSNQPGIARLIADLRTAKVELLSAQCAADRLRLQYSVADIVSFGDPQALKVAIASVGALCRFFSAVEEQMKRPERGK